MRSAVLVIVVVLALIGSGCGRKKNRVQAPVSSRPVLPSTIGAYEEGIASWYGDPYHGRRTANGEYQLLTAEQVFHDYQFSTNNEIALPESTT